MKKLVTLSGILAGFFLIIIFYQPSSVLAAEAGCHLEHCLVPAPTVYLPKNQTVIVGNNLNVVGLTWKRTIVKVYLDGIEVSGVKQYNHEDYYAGFYATTPVKPGQHYLYTIAHSEKPGWFDQSIESTYVYFTVTAPAAAVVSPQPRIAPEVAPEPEKVDTNSTLPDYLNQADDAATNTVSSLDVVEGQIEGGVSVEANTSQDNLSASNDPSAIQTSEELNKQDDGFAAELQPAGQKNELSSVLENEFTDSQRPNNGRRNRLIGLGVLAVLVIGYLLGRWVSANSIKNQFLKEPDKDLPPAPTPPLAPASTNNQPENDRPITVEPIKDDESEPLIEVIAKDEPKDYWASAGPTPYTPYPLGETEEKNDRPDEPGHLT